MSEQTLIHFPLGSGGVEIKELNHGEDGYRLEWTDGVANDWWEWYPALPDAIARGAVLAKCVLEADERTHYGFRQIEPTSFADLASAFFDETLDRVDFGH
jgi:hypothetical protein